MAKIKTKLDFWDLQITKIINYFGLHRLQARILVFFFSLGFCVAMVLFSYFISTGIISKL
jgi:hypothetical protein